MGEVLYKGGGGEHESKLKDAPFSPTRNDERHTMNPRGIADSQYVEHREDNTREVQAIDRR